MIDWSTVYRTGSSQNERQTPPLAATIEKRRRQQHYRDLARTVRHFDARYFAEIARLNVKRGTVNGAREYARLSAHYAS